MAEVCLIRLNRYCLFVCYSLQVGPIMNESNSHSNPGSSDLNVDKSAIEFILSRQDKQFSILTETLRRTLNEFGQDLGTHLHEFLDTRLKEKESAHVDMMPGSSSYPPSSSYAPRRE